MRRAAPGIALFLVTLAGPGSARADDPAAQARARFERGTELFDEGNLEGALVEFEASFALRPVPVVLFNIAQTHKLLLRYPEAIEAYRRYLSLGGPSLPAERVEEVRTTIARLERSMGTIVVECAPAGARVSIDGHAVGQAPATVPTAAGLRHVEVSAPGRLVAARDVQLAAGATERLCLRPGPAAAAVEVGSGAAGEGAARGGGGSIFGRWWFWTAAVVVVAAGVTGAILIASPADPEPVGGNVDPDVIGAAWRP